MESQSYGGPSTSPGGIQDRTGRGAGNTDCEGGNQSDIANDGDEQSLGIVGSDRTGGDFPWLIAGGIIGQLIAAERDRLAEMQASVDWYQDQVAKSEARLKSWETLQNELAKE